MSKRDKPFVADTRTRETMEPGVARGDVANSKGKAHAWAPVNKLPGPGKQFDARRKVPSGPLGGSGRKTNLSRSS